MRVMAPLLESEVTRKTLRHLGLPDTPPPPMPPARGPPTFDGPAFEPDPAAARPGDDLFAA
mgnify:CR=1 FL=1